MNRAMLRAVVSALTAVALLLGLAVALFEYSTEADQQRFRDARNECERGCIQDSGGLDGCRKACKGHPDHYP